MKVVYNHASALVAQAARDHLLAHGILSAVMGRTEGWLAAVQSYDVMLCFSKQAARAQELLADDAWLPQASEEAAGQADEAIPDLSGLDPSLAAACPGCGMLLPLDESCQVCPACGHRVDVAELIVQTHGPEALEACYGRAEQLLSNEQMNRLILLCPGCQHSLEGLPRVGLCVACGLEYDKDQIVRDFLSS